MVEDTFFCNSQESHISENLDRKKEVAKSWREGRSTMLRGIHQRKRMGNRPQASVNAERRTNRILRPIHVHLYGQEIESEGGVSTGGLFSGRSPTTAGCATRNRGSCRHVKVECNLGGAETSMHQVPVGNGHLETRVEVMQPETGGFWGTVEGSHTDTGTRSVSQVGRNYCQRLRHNSSA